MEGNFTGIVIAVATFIIIGLFHPVVIKTEYYFGTKYWWVFLVVGILALYSSIIVDDTYMSMILGVFGVSSIWSIIELFEQRERVKKGWFPRNPHREE